MIIGIDASRANRKHKSGTEWYSYYLIKLLAKIDKKNNYILYSDKPLIGDLVDLTDEKNDNHKNEFDKHGYQILKSPHNNFKAKVLKWPFNFLWTQGRLSLEMIIKKPDILFIPAHTLPLIHPRNSIVTLHDIGFERDRLLYRRDQMGPGDKRGKNLLNFFVKLFTGGKYSANSMDYSIWSTQFAIKKAKKIITVSNFSKKELIDVYGKENKIPQLENKITVIYNGYNKYLYREVENEAEIDRVLDKYGIKKPYLLYVGRLEKKKNTPALIEAFAILKEKNKDIKHKLVLVGDASFGFDEVKYTISEYLLEEDVVMPGWIEETDMPHIYSAADAFVFPSLYEGFGIPLLQAMSCNVPITSSRTTSIPEVVKDAALMFNPRNVENISNSMEKIIKDKDLRKQLIRKGQAQVKNFSWDKCAEETLKLINSLKS